MCKISKTNNKLKNLPNLGYKIMCVWEQKTSEKDNGRGEFGVNLSWNMGMW